MFTKRIILAACLAAAAPCAPGCAGRVEAQGQGGAGGTAPAAATGTAAAGGAEEKKVDEYQTSATGLKWKDLKVGEGASPSTGQTVSVHYTGWLLDGKKFDSSRDRGQPFKFQIGKGQVIKGWDEGVASMKVGGRRELLIPPELAYGSRGFPGAIPPSSTLKFDVELLGVQ